jgi:hypothetical protein
MFSIVFVRLLNIIFFNPSIGGLVIRFGQTDVRTVLTKLILAYRKCVKDLIEFTLAYFVKHLQVTYLHSFVSKEHSLRIM